MALPNGITNFEQSYWIIIMKLSYVLIKWPNYFHNILIFIVALVRLFSVMCWTADGNLLILIMGVHCKAKKLLKKFAFSLKLATTLLFIIGEIKGILMPLWNVVL